MLLNFTPETKQQLLRHDGLAVVIRFLAHERDTNRKMASWVLSAWRRCVATAHCRVAVSLHADLQRRLSAGNLVVDGSVNDHVRVLGGIPNLVRLLGEADPFVREQGAVVAASVCLPPPLVNCSCLRCCRGHCDCCLSCGQ